MKPKKKRSKIYEIRLYIGYGKPGAEKYKAIKKDAKTLGMKLSKYITVALKWRYPNLPL